MIDSDVSIDVATSLVVPLDHFEHVPRRCSCRDGSTLLDELVVWVFEDQNELSIIKISDCDSSFVELLVGRES